MKRYLFYVSELYGFAIVRPLQNIIMSCGDSAAWFFEDPEKMLPYVRKNEKILHTVDSVKNYDPGVVFVPGNMVPDFFPGVKVQLFHGFHARKRSDERGHFRIRNFFDLYCTQGPETTRPFQELAKIHGFFEVEETGWPKMDPLFEKHARTVPKKDGNVVLMTSTFTPRLSCAAALFDTVRQIADNGPWKWLVNFHPKMAPEIVTKYKSIQSRNLVFVETDDIIPLLKAADVMVSDTSSVISEFLLQHKPVVTYKNRAPGPHLFDIETPEKLEQSIAYALTRPDHLMGEVKKYADLIHPYRDGRSSIRVLDAAARFAAKGRDHLKPKPFNLLRSLKIRKQLGYYRF